MELVLIRGLPGSGKSTIARALTLLGYQHIEADQYFERAGRYQFDASELAQAHAWCLDQVIACLKQRKRCAVANTFSQQWEIQPYLDAARAANVPVRIIEANGKWQNTHNVPEETITRMLARWETIRL